MESFKVQVEVTVDLQVIDDTLVTALEGGSNYWYYLKTQHVKEPEGFSRNKSIHHKFLDYVYQGSSMKVYDVNDKDDCLGELSLKSIQDGLTLMSKDYSDHFKEMIDEQGDAETADIFFQLCIMGENAFA